MFVPIFSSLVPVYIAAWISKEGWGDFDEEKKSLGREAKGTRSKPSPFSLFPFFFFFPSFHPRFLILQEKRRILSSKKKGVPRSKKKREREKKEKKRRTHGFGAGRWSRTDDGRG